jgi:cytochrome P450
MNKPLDQINPFDPAVLVDPWDYYQAALADAPIQHVPGTNTWIVLSYDLVAEAAGRVEDFANDFKEFLSGERAEDPEVKEILKKGWPQVNTLLTADPPVHTRYRKLVNLAFSMKRVDAIEDEIRAITLDLIEGFAGKGECEFVDEFAVPLPVRVIAGQIGLGEGELARVKRWSDAFVDRLSHMISREREIECAREVVEFQHVVKGKIDERRTHAEDDLLSDLVNARIEDERPLDDAELLSIMQQLMVAGNETTTSSLAGGLLHLIRNPGQMAKAEAAAGGRDKKLLANMVEEILRYESPTSGMWRLVTHDTELGGVALPKGAMINLRYAAANRDPAKYENPDTFDIERANARTNLAFGRGIHMCVGNMLSRRELLVAFDELLSRLCNFAIPDESAITVPPNMLLRGITRLPVTFERRA